MKTNEIINFVSKETLKGMITGILFGFILVTAILYYLHITFNKPWASSDIWIAYIILMSFFGGVVGTTIFLASCVEILIEGKIRR